MPWVSRLLQLLRKAQRIFQSFASHLKVRCRVIEWFSVQWFDFSEE